MELELADEDAPVLYVFFVLFPADMVLKVIVVVRYRVGEAFAHMRHSQAMKRLEKDQNDLNTELSALKDKAEECEKEMKELKVILYAKFGRAINLDE